MQDDDQAFQQEVKKALKYSYDFAYLRSCPLVSLLPHGHFLSAEERANALQQLLREAVEYLRPPGKPSESDSRWWPYYILYYRYIEAQSRAQVMRKLAISRATFYRDLGKAIATVSEFLKEREKELHPPPVSPRPPPCVEKFVGREKELAAYRRQLKEKGFAIIAGPPGAGKTALGAELAAKWQAEGHPVLWVTLRSGRNVTLEALLENIALSLAAKGQDDYWRFLRAERRKQVPLSLDSRVRYLLTILEQGGYTLCLDDYQLVNENQAINSLCTDLLRDAKRRKIWLLVMSRVRPRFARGHVFEPLAGLDRGDAICLLKASGLSAKQSLPEDIFAELYARTGGLPIFLKLFASWARSQGLENVESEEARRQLTAFAGNMVKEQDVRNYLLREVYQTFSPQERRFLTCVTVFRLPFKTEYQLVIALLKAEGVEDIDATWMALVERHVFTPLKGQDTIILHPLLRAYFAQRLRHSPDERMRIHRRVGEYYERNVGDALPPEGIPVVEAGHHYFEAGEYERAARVLVGNMRWLINAGQTELALEQLDRLIPHLAREAGVEPRFEAAAAREVLYHLLGKREKQAAALDTLQALAETDERRLAIAYNRRARFHLVMGEFATAITAAREGQAAARRAGDKEIQGESFQHWGVALRLRGDYAAARERHEQALALAREIGDQRVEAAILNSLGNICHRLCDLSAAQGLYEQALAIYQTTADRRGTAGTLNNLGNVRYCLGDYTAALDSRKQALYIWRVIGDRLGEAASLSNLGIVYCTLGECAAGRAYFEQALTIARAIADRLGEGVNLHNLGDVCHKEGHYAAARAHYEQSLAIRRSINDQPGVSYTLTGLGKVLEGLGDLDEVQAAYRQALTIQRELGQVALAIDNVAGLARVALARGRVEEARGYVEECLAYIATQGVEGIEYVFEVYLTCGHVLEDCGERQRARGVLEEAHALLMERADKIGDGDLRRSFLENVPAHRELAGKNTQHAIVT